MTSIEEAAELFEISCAIVRRFIEAWDRFSGSDAACTALLQDVLSNVMGAADPVLARNAGCAPAQVDRETPFLSEFASMSMGK